MLLSDPRVRHVVAHERSGQGRECVLVEDSEQRAHLLVDSPELLDCRAVSSPLSSLRPALDAPGTAEATNLTGRSLAKKTNATN